MDFESCGPLVVVALGQFVELGALLHGHKPGDAKLGAGPLHGRGPLAQAGALELLLAPLELLLGDDLPGLVLHEVLLRQAALGPVGVPAPDAPHASVDDLAPLGLAGPAGGPLAGAAAAGGAARRAATGPLGGAGPAARTAAGGTALGGPGGAGPAAGSRPPGGGAAGGAAACLG